MLNVVAIVCARNEALHVQRCIRDFCMQGIEVILIDNGSSDETLELARPFLGHGLQSIQQLPWDGAFSLSRQLALKASVAAASRAEWIIHADPDEWLVPSPDHQSLLSGIEAAHRTGYNCINFKEFVFLPAGDDFAHPNYAAMMKHYYYFAPSHPRLMRAWKRGDGLTNQLFGGHVLAGGDIRLSPNDFFLRHYIILSQEHGRAKYCNRIFSGDELEKGWHGNRVNITSEKLVVPRSDAIKSLPFAASQDFDMSMPVEKHYWEWER